MSQLLTTGVIQGSLLNQIPAGIYMITEEGYYMCEEDNEDILFIEEDEE